MIVRMDLPMKVSANKVYAGMNPFARAKIKKYYAEFSKPYFTNIKGFENKVNIEMFFYFHKKPLDSSNCFFMAKMLEDCLVSHGVINNDTNKYVGSFTVKSISDYRPVKKRRIKSDYVKIIMI